MNSTFKTYDLLNDIGIKKISDVTKILKKIPVSKIREMRNEIYKEGKNEIIPIGQDFVRPAWGHLNFPAIRFSGNRYIEYDITSNTNSLFGGNPNWDMPEHSFASRGIPDKSDLIEINKDYWFRSLINFVDNNIKMHLLSGAEKIIIDNPLGTLPVTLDQSCNPWERAWSYPDSQEEKLDHLPNIHSVLYVEDYTRRKKELGIDDYKLANSVINWQMLQDWIGLLLHIRPWVEKGEIIFRINCSIPLDDDGWCFRSFYLDDFIRNLDLYESKIFDNLSKNMGIFKYHPFPLFDEPETDYDSSLVYHYRISPFIETLIESTLLSFNHDASPLRIPKNQISLLKTRFEPEELLFFTCLDAVVRDLSDLTGKHFELQQKKVKKQAEDLKFAIKYYSSLKRDYRIKEIKKLERELKHTWGYLWKDLILGSSISGAFKFYLDLFPLDIKKILLAFLPLAGFMVKGFINKEWDKNKILKNSDIGPLWTSIKIRK